jgi:hypothetical protein
MKPRVKIDEDLTKQRKNLRKKSYDDGDSPIDYREPKIVNVRGQN